MSDYISKKALTDALNGKAEIHEAVGNVNAAGELRAWVTRIERWEFSIPSPAEGRYREADGDIAQSYDIELRSLVNKLLEANDYYAADAVEKLADRMKRKCNLALSPIGEQKEDTEQ